MPREADLRYQPKCKDLKDAMCWLPKKPNQADIDLAIKVLDNRIEELERQIKEEENE